MHYPVDRTEVRLIMEGFGHSLQGSRLDQDRFRTDSPPIQHLQVHYRNGEVELLDLVRLLEKHGITREDLIEILVEMD